MSLKEELFQATAKTEAAWHGSASSGTAVFVVTYEKTNTTYNNDWSLFFLLFSCKMY